MDVKWEKVICIKLVQSNLSLVDTLGIHENDLLSRLAKIQVYATLNVNWESSVFAWQLLVVLLCIDKMSLDFYWSAQEETKYFEIE